MMSLARLRGTGAENLPWQPDPRFKERFLYRPSNSHITFYVENLSDTGRLWWLCHFGEYNYIARDTYAEIVQAVRARPIEDFGGVDVIAELEKYRA